MIEAFEKAWRFQRTHGTRLMAREIAVRIKRRLFGYTPPPVVIGPPQWVTASALVRRSKPLPLNVFNVPAEPGSRVSIVTDSVNRGSLYGGVGTAVLLGALIANARGARLRIVTRTEKAEPQGVQTVLATYGIALARETEFAWAPADDATHEIDCLPGELFITTSWWTTAATLAAVPPSSILYLLQEDERMFYPWGDDRLRCEQVLAHPGIRFAINTRLLYDHLVGSGLGNIAERGTWFEPAFPREVFHPRPRPAQAKRTLAFYARPHNLRNLFHFGIELLEAAVARGVLDLSQWDIVLVGKDIPDVRFDEGACLPQRLQNLSWTEYADFAGRTDLALCLMYTPHPSYPPFDMAASGAVVVTNRYANKQDLSGYCANILCGELDIEAMLPTLAQGLALAADTPRRSANHQAAALQGRWSEALAPVVQQFGTPACST